MNDSRDKVARNVSRRRLAWHPCRGIAPDGRAFGYICTNCGREIEPWGDWWRHTDLFREDVSHQ